VWLVLNHAPGWRSRIPSLIGVERVPGLKVRDNEVQAPPARRPGRQPFLTGQLDRGITQASWIALTMA
jgi:hypothetical protein